MEEQVICVKCLCPTDTLVASLCDDCYWEEMKAIEE